MDDQIANFSISDISSFREMIINQRETITNNNSQFNDKIIDLETSKHLASEKVIKKVVITIPAYNEEKTIGKVVQNIRNVMDQTKYCFNYFILVVNDGSIDKTAERASESGAFVYSHTRNYGLAQTFRTEMKLCLEIDADIIVHTDADGQYKAEEIPFLINEVENGFDLVLGSRFKGKIESMSWLKRFGNIVFSMVISVLSLKKVSDGQTGFRAFNKNIAQNIPIISNHTYTQEQIIRTSKKGYSIKEFPIYFAKRSDGVSRLMKNPLEYAKRAWENIFKVLKNCR